MKKGLNYEKLFAIPQEEVDDIMKLVEAKCKKDKSFELALMTNPTETLTKEGLELLPGVHFQIVNTEEEANRLPNHVIPLTLANRHACLPLDDLDKVAGGQGPEPEDYALWELLENRHKK